MRDPSGPVWDVALDELAMQVFAGDRGRERIAPLLTRWDAEVGALHEEDPEHAAWQAMRTDWALCDASLGAPGDTWAWRAATGALSDVRASPRIAVLARSIAGLWEVTPGRRLWLCDALSGIGLQVADPEVGLLDAPQRMGRGPAALWEVRVVVIGGRAHLCRPPIAYPVAVADEVRRRGLARLPSRDATRHDVLLGLRRRRLQWARAPRADAAILFRGY